jgi:hypothetical protein
MVADEKDKGARVFRKARIYPLCPNLGTCPELLHPAMRGLLITGSMERMEGYVDKRQTFPCFCQRGQRRREIV